MLLTYLMLAVALCLSAVAAFYSIVGLAAIFSAAVLPIVLMGSILEVAKLVVTVWLHEYWTRVKLTMKCYLVPAVGVLMLITSMGIFGFLSKAHLDQAVPTGDVAAQVSLLDEKIKTQRDNVEAARSALRQMDSAVDQTLSRSADEKGADKAAALRRQQGAERNRLQADIARAQTEIARLNEQRAPIASQLRKVEAEVGPIKYIAALIYGDNPDANLLEKAVRWVIIILVLVFDPLAVMMLLAATESHKWEREKTQVTEPAKEEPENATISDDEPITEDMDGHPPGDILEPEPITTMVAQPETANINYQVLDDADDEAEVSTSAQQDVDYQAAQKTVTTTATKESEWEGSEIDNESRLFFGPIYPRYPRKGDLFLKINTLPTTLYKFNGEKWIDTDKTLTDRYAFNPQYIDYLIRKIGTGEYDPELLTNAEREQIALRLKQDLK